MLNDFRVAEYLGPKESKSLELLAGEAPVTLAPVEEIEGVPCIKVVDVIEEVFEDVVEEVEVTDFRFETINGKSVKRSAGKKKVKQVVGKRKVRDRVTGQKTVGRSVTIIRGEDRIASFSQRVKDSKAIGENFYVWAEDLESMLHRDSLKDAVMQAILSPDVLDALKKRLEDDLVPDLSKDDEAEIPRRGPGRPPKPR